MSKPASVEAYIAAAPEDRRPGLEALRRTVTAAAPQAEECIAYDMPAYRLHGRFVVSFAAFKRHYSLFPASQVVIDDAGGGGGAAREGPRHAPVPGRRAAAARPDRPDRPDPRRRDRGCRGAALTRARLGLSGAGYSGASVPWWKRTCQRPSRRTQTDERFDGRGGPSR